MTMTAWIGTMTLIVSVLSASAQPALQKGVDQLRHTLGNWSVVTEFLNEDGSVAKAVEGTYRFTWVVVDRVLSGRSEIPELRQSSGILFFVNERKLTIEKISVGADGKDTQLRFTRFNVKPDSFESKMEFSRDGGATWLPGNRQRFRRVAERGLS